MIPIKYRNLILVVAATLLACTKQSSQSLWLAKVNGTSIKVSDFERRMRLSQKDLGDIPVLPGNGMTRLKSRILSELVATQLFLEEASRRSITITEDNVELEIEKLREQVGLRVWQSYLLDHYVDERIWRQHLKEQMTVEALLANELNTVQPVTEADINSYFAEISDSTPSQAGFDLYQIVVTERDVADRVRMEIKAGAEFADVAKKHSIGPEASVGGSLGFVEKESLPASFAPAFRLKPGQLSNVVETEYGYHLFLVKTIRNGHQPAIDDLRESIKRSLISERKQAIKIQLLDNLRAKAEIEINEEAWRDLLQK